MSDKSELKLIPAATAQEPGLYAIHYLDNWDGEGDTYHILAELSADGIWSRHENGCKLLKYKGDEILQVWPLRNGAAQEPVAVEVMRFQLKHPASGETHTVEFTRAEVADGLEDCLYEKLSTMACQCDGHDDCECADYIYDFDLIVAPPATEQPGTVPVPRNTLARLFAAFDTDGANPDPVMDELRALLADVLVEADRLLDSMNNLSGWIDGNAGECETHGPAVIKARALLGKEGV